MCAAASIGKSLRINGVAKTYATRAGEPLSALGPISIDVEAGEFFVVVGPSGCGKTTLLHLLAGFLKPTEGQILVGGEPIAGPGLDRSVVFQSYALFPWLSVIENVEFGLRAKRMSRSRQREIALHQLRLVGLESFANKRIDELSGGMKQRVAIARAFAVEPSILLMDEPFGALDALTRAALQRWLGAALERLGATCLLVTHDVEEALLLADRVVVLSPRPGRVVAEIPVELPRDACPRRELILSAEFLELRERALEAVEG